MDTAAYLARCVDKLNCLQPRPDAVALTGALDDFGGTSPFYDASGNLID